MRKIFVFLLFFNCFNATAQITTTYQINGISTAVPFLRITPDARAGGMGETGIATTPDIHSIFWNTAKLAFINNKFGISTTYTPWLREIVDDIYLLDVSSFYKIDSTNALTASIRYFSLGSLIFNNPAPDIGNYNPRELTAHIGYARKISAHFSTGINLGYVYSNLISGQSFNGVPIRPGEALAIDLSGYYVHPIKINSVFKRYDLGLSLSNFGTKIAYTYSAEQKDFLPTNLGIGSAFHFQPGRKHQLSFALDLNKLIVPLPAWDDAGKYPRLSTGVEYIYNSLFFLRGGYFYQKPTDGGSDYFTVGTGIKYKALKFDFSYLISDKKYKTVLDNTYRLGLSFLFK